MRWRKDDQWIFLKPVEEVFQYYNNIESYPAKYPKYYRQITILNKTHNQVQTKEFLNLNLDVHRDHTIISVKYNIVNNKEISFEITDGTYGKGIKNKLEFEATEGTTISNGITKHIPATTVNGTIPPLEICALPPGNKNSNEYNNMLLYFGNQDRINLLKEYLGYEMGQLCNQCYKGTLKPSGKKIESSKDKKYGPVKRKTIRTEKLICDFCGDSPPSTTNILLE